MRDETPNGSGDRDGPWPAALLCLWHAEPGGRRLSLHGELDCSTVPRLQQAFQEISLDAHAVILDVAGLTFIDSSGVNAILSSLGSVPSLRVAEPRGQVRDTLARLGLLERLTAVDVDPA